MKDFINWFTHTASDRSERRPSLKRAWIAHLHFVPIHPFEDGHGRIALAIAEKALAQTLRQPALIALAANILAKRKVYYEALETSSRNVSTTVELSNTVKSLGRLPL